MKNIENIEKEIVAWQAQTFPNATIEAKRKKLLEECKELIAALLYGGVDHALEEAADVFIVAASIANDRQHFDDDVTMTMIIADKLEVNKSRQWGDEDSEGDRPRERIEICKTCGGTGTVKYYHDAGDHFGAGSSPWSEWRDKPCPDCKRIADKIAFKERQEEIQKTIDAAIGYSKTLDW